MDFLRRIEDDVRNLGVEAKRKHPEVREAAERGLVMLKAMRESYVAEVMKASGASAPKIAKFRSAEVSAPYILACNHVDANPKLIKLSLNGLQMLLNYEVVPPSEAPNILRVLNIQVACGVGEIQLKILQIVLQLANSLAQDAQLATQYLTQATLGSMLAISLELIDSSMLNSSSVSGGAASRLGLGAASVTNSLAVSSTAFATTRQLVALVMDAACDSLTESADKMDNTRSSPSQLPDCALLILRELATSISGERLQSSHQQSTNDWLRGTHLAPIAALDLLLDVVSGWKHLFELSASFRSVLKDPLCKCLYPLIRSLSSECSRNPAYVPVMQKSLKLSRCLLLTFLHFPDAAAELEILFQTLNHALIPDRADESLQPSTPESGFSTAAGIMARLAITKPTAVTHAATATTSPRHTSSAATGTTIPLITLQSLHGPAYLPCSVASLILEACFSFLLSDDVCSLLGGKPGGKAAIVGILSSAVLSCCNLLCEGLANEQNVRDFEIEVRSSQLVTLVEGVLTGTETDCSYVIRTLHDHFSTSNVLCIMPADVLLLSFMLLQVLCRLFARSVVSSSGNCEDSDERGDRHFYALSSGGTMGTKNELACENGRSISQVCENTYDRIQETCLTLLGRSEDFGVVRRSIGVLSELTLSTGLLRLHRPSDFLLSTLCKLTVPEWHCPAPDRCLPASATSPVRWRHVQAFVRLSQVVHVLADLVADWDAVVDSFEQLVDLLSHTGSAGSGTPPIHEDLTQLDVDKIFQAVDRFMSYTVFISDDSLVRLMTSLVALSLNSLAVAATTAPPLGGSSTPSGGATAAATRPTSNTKQFGAQSTSGEGGKLRAAPYMAEALNQHVVSYALHAAVEIAKVNSFRVSCIWQMVTSHLRMVASHKVKIVRAVAVAATNDIVCAALEFMLRGTTSATEISFIDQGPHIAVIPVDAIALTDDTLYNGILPSFETVFTGRIYQRVVLGTRLHPVGAEGGPHLTQIDILSSLRALAQIKYPDVRDQIMEGLLELLQGSTQEAVAGGWKVIIDLLTSVPQSLVPAPGRLTVMSTVLNGTGVASDYNTDDHSAEDDASRQSEWQRSSLVIAFQCIKLVVDDFLETISRDVMTGLVACLSAFSAQTCDVNISLTSVEMLWKVTDFVVAKSRAEGDVNTTSAVLDVMMTRLLQLAMDSRPEVRNCATNTLFAAVVANSSMLTSAQWRSVFNDIIFPLFGKIESRSCVAMKNKEQARAPEIKKGVKMTVHHSRDTGHKQWSETRVLALRGLARVMRACTRLLMCEDGFKLVWSKALEICIDGTQSNEADMEVTLAAADTLFEMVKVASRGTYKLKTRAAQGMRIIGGALVAEESSSEHTMGPNAPISGVSTKIDSNLNEEGANDERGAVREELWRTAWKHVRLSMCFETSGYELPGHFCKHLKDLYNGGKDEEFKYSHFVQNLLELVPALARRRVRVVEASSPFKDVDGVVAHNNWIEILDHDASDASAGSSTRLSKHASSQLHREVMSLLRVIRPSDSVAYAALLKTLSDIAFGTDFCLMELTTLESTKSVVLAPVDQKLRLDCCDLLLTLLRLINGESDPQCNEQEQEETFVPPTSQSWLSATADVISTRSWVNTCVGPLLRRKCTIMTGDPGETYTALATDNPLTNEAPSTHGSRLSAFAADVVIFMRHLAVAEYVSETHSKCNELTKGNFIMQELHILVKLCDLPASCLVGDVCWNNLISFVGCALVPWMTWELQCQWSVASIEQLNQLLLNVYGDTTTSFPVLLYNASDLFPPSTGNDEVDVSEATMINLLNGLVRIAIHSKYERIVEAGARLVDALVGSARLCIWIVGNEERMCLPKFHVTILRHVITCLANIAAGVDTDSSIRTRALSGCMILLKDFADIATKAALANDQTFCMICAHLLTLLLDVPSSLADIHTISSFEFCSSTSSDAAVSPTSISAALFKWFCSLRKSNSSVVAPKITNSIPQAAIHDKPHIYIVADTARVWLESSCVELKQVAMSVIRNVNTSDLLLQYVKIMQYVQKLETENTAMKSEVNVLKSATSLPF